MVQIILRERTLDCKCKRLHAIKFASVLADIQEVNYMLYWVCEYLLYLLRLNDMYSIELSFHSPISYLTSFH